MFQSNQFNDFNYNPHNYLNPGLWKTIKQLHENREGLKPKITQTFEAREGFISGLGSYIDDTPKALNPQGSLEKARKIGNEGGLKDGTDMVNDTFSNDLTNIILAGGDQPDIAGVGGRVPDDDPMAGDEEQKRLYYMLKAWESEIPIVDDPALFPQTTVKKTPVKNNPRKFQDSIIDNPQYEAAKSRIKKLKRNLTIYNMNDVYYFHDYSVNIIGNEFIFTDKNGASHKFPISSGLGYLLLAQSNEDVMKYIDYGFIKYNDVLNMDTLLTLLGMTMPRGKGIPNTSKWKVIEKLKSPKDFPDENAIRDIRKKNVADVIAKDPGILEGHGLKYYSNINDLVQRLDVLMASIKTGNSSKQARNEAGEIIDILLKNKKITMAEYKKLYSLF